MARRSGRQRRVRSAPTSARVAGPAPLLGRAACANEPADVEVRGLGEVAVAAQAAHVGEVAARRGALNSSGDSPR